MSQERPTLELGPFGVTNVGHAGVVGEQIRRKVSEVPVPVGGQNGLKATFIEFVEKEVLFFAEVAEVVLVVLVKIALLVLDNNVDFLTLDDDVDFPLFHNRIVFVDPKRLISHLVGDKRCTFEISLAVDFRVDVLFDFVADAEKGVPQARAFGFGFGRRVDSLLRSFAGGLDFRLWRYDLLRDLSAFDTQDTRGSAAAAGALRKL